jgi:hypothetical protein
MPSFKVPCPSCEAQVLIKNPNLVGTKVECPKCKYRFKVEEPKDEAAGGAGKKKDEEKGKKGKKPPNKKVVAGVVIGIVAVLVLAGVGYLILGGGDKKNKTVDQPPRPYTPPKTTEPKDEDQPPTPKNAEARIPAGVKAITNLLHPDSVAVFRFDLERVRTSALGPQLYDPNTAKLFQTSMGFDINEVSNCFYCAVGQDRAPFVVMQIRTARKVDETEKKMGLTRAHGTFGSRSLYKVDSNPFVTAVASTFTVQSLFADFLNPVAPPKTAATPDDRAHGICVYDTQTILVGDLAVLDDYLKSLGPTGFPPVTGVSQSAKDAGPDLSQVTVYQTLEPGLRRAMLSVEGLDAPAAIVVWAEKFDAKRFDPKLLKDDYKPIADGIAPLTSLPGKIQYYGVRLSDLDRQRLNIAALLFLAETDTGPLLTALSPKLKAGTLVASLLLSPSVTKDDTPIVYRDLTGHDDSGMNPGVGPVPGGPIGQPPGPMGPQPGPPRGGPIMGEGGAGGAPVMQPGPMGPMGPGGAVDPNALPADTSHVTLSEHEGMVVIRSEIKWKEPVFNQVVFPRLKFQTDTLKGQLEVRSGTYDTQVLTKVTETAGKVPVPPKREDYNAFPRGTVYRNADSRFPIPAAPEDRLSLFVGILPYLGRDPMVRAPQAAWYDPRNLDGASQWVPELLVPYYPSSSWRVESGRAPGRTLGGTNYVGIAGRGANAARLDPANPEHQKLMGMTGYDWNSTPAEVKDGLSNTIYLMQVKPGIARPWMAGGGATLMGMNDQGGHPMDDFAYTHPGRAKPGAYALMGDNSVRFVPADIKREVVLGMATRAGDGKELLPGEDAPLIPANKGPIQPGDMPMPEKKDKDMTADEAKK